MTTPADIVNRALQLVGGYNNAGPVRGTPPAFDGTAQGIAAGTLYAGVIETIGRQFGFDFQRNVADLVLTGSPAPLGFALEYLYPSNGIQVLQIVPPIIDRNDPRPQLWTVGNSLGPSAAASGSILFSVNPSVGDTITLNGIPFTFVASGASPTNFQSNIAGDIHATLNLLINFLPPNGYGGLAPLTAASYSNVTPYLSIVYNTLGPSGNIYTLEASAAAVSGPTLTGGADALQKVIWTDLVDAIATFSNQPPTDTWDPLFTEAVVRLLASELDMALSSKPESAKSELQNATGFAQLGEMRTDS